MRNHPALLALLVTSAAVAGPGDFASWPDGKSPREIGGRVASRFAADPRRQNFGRPGQPGHITYSDTIA